MCFIKMLPLWLNVRPMNAGARCCALVIRAIIFVKSLALSEVSAAGRKGTQAFALFAEAFMLKHHNLTVWSAVLL
jgi:hypothetical protein